MINHSNVLKPILLSGALALVFGLQSCSDKADSGSLTKSRDEKKETAAAKEMIKRLPDFQVVDKKTGKMFRVAEDGFSFTNPGDGGWNFSSPSGATYTNNETGGTFTIASSSFGQTGGGSSGLIQAGGSSIPINYTFCFSAGEEFFGGNLFTNGGGGNLFDGVSAVIGVSGDFEALQNQDPNGNTELKDIFKGMGMYIVYDKQASGNYKILNWVDILNEDEVTTNSLKDKGFAFFIDFVNEKVYFSYDGSLDVSGGSITFTGRYLETAWNTNDENPTTKIVQGLGTMGCN